MSDFFSMGGYGFYVWISYAVALALLIFPVIKVAYLTKKNKKNASAV